MSQNLDPRASTDSHGEIRGHPSNCEFRFGLRGVSISTFGVLAIARYIYIPHDMLKSLALLHEPSA
jgi:hypothetical protein